MHEDVFPMFINFLHYHSDVGRLASDTLSAFAHQGEDSDTVKMKWLKVSEGDLHAEIIKSMSLAL